MTNQAARELIEVGAAVIPIPFKAKNPGASGWQKLRVTSANVDDYFPPGARQNIGVLMGEPSNWLVDVDLDHAYAVEMADEFLPETPAVFGRASKPRSHRLYRVSQPIRTVQHKSPDAETIVEIRSTGCQTVVPPSVHPSGEPISWEHRPAEPVTINPALLSEAVDRLKRAVLCRLAMDRIGIADGKDGSRRMMTYACRCIEHDLSETESLATIRWQAQEKPFPREWSDSEICKRLADAERKADRGKAAGEALSFPSPEFVSADVLIAQQPRMRPPVIDGLIRIGETGAIIAPSKRGKSWLVNDIALSVATGAKLFGRFDVQRGPVLLVDNELHPETLADRINRVTQARFVEPSEYAGRLYVESLRGRLADIHAMQHYFDQIEPGRFRLVILDAFYRFLPGTISENDNAGMAQVFNALDRYAGRLGCAFLYVHHSSKGDQSGKSITDVGSGAGAQARAVDAHLVMRQHEDSECVVFDGVVRSFPPVDPVVLRWNFPVWNVDESADAQKLKRPESERQIATDRETDAAIHALLLANPEGATKHVLRKETGFSFDRITRGVSRAIREGRMEVTDQKPTRNGKASEAYRLTERSDSRSDSTPRDLP